MTMKRRVDLCWQLCGVLVLAGGWLVAPAAAQSASAKAASTPQAVATRLLFQDEQASTLRWADLRVGGGLSLGDVQEVAGFPKLDPQRQRLVQMEAVDGWLLVGVRDDAGGTFQSGWVLVETGVVQESHGDHFDWRYAGPPRVRAVCLDDQQGNPAHLYVYDGVFYLANDRRGGVTRLDPRSIRPGDSPQDICAKAKFYSAGGGHITLAAVKDRVLYATWIDREGEHAGRVDVVPLSGPHEGQHAYALSLPSGGLHGATTAGGKVFFAPAVGICWVAADLAPRPHAPQPPVHHLDLGTDGERPRRTGGFATLGAYVAFVTGGGPDAALYVIDAAAKEPQPIRVPVPMAEGNRPAGLRLVRPRASTPVALLFHDHPADVDAPNLMTIVALDPNGDGDWRDAKVQQELEVGPSRVQDHAGHHAVAFDADGRRAIVSNPGDGTLAVYSFDQSRLVAQFTVGGCPAKLVAIGGREHAH